MTVWIATRYAPEPQVITPALKGAHRSPLILSPNCTNCGRCIDICGREVFKFDTRYSALDIHSFDKRKVAP